MKKILKIVGIVLLVILAAVLAYAAYVMLSYSRLGDIELPVEQTDSTKMQADNEYRILTYNIGFGAYQQDYTCVLDHAYIPDENGGWERVTGKNLKALSYEDAERNTNGAADTVVKYEPDFVMIQEIDSKSDRARGINQVQLFLDKVPHTGSSYCINFHTPYLCYPLNDMMGKAESGLLTLSKYGMVKADRHEFAVTDNVFSRLFDLDRCFSASYIDVDNGKQLVLVNQHMSAYDEGGVIRSKQREQLYSFIAAEYEKGNYVIVGGDFNHDLLTNNPAYPAYTSEKVAFSDQFTEKMPDNVVFFFDDQHDADLPEGFRVEAADNSSTCRPAAITWQPGFSYMRVLDGFIVSDNVTVTKIENQVTSTDQLVGYAYSDHEPVLMQFRIAK